MSEPEKSEGIRLLATPDGNFHAFTAVWLSSESKIRIAVPVPEDCYLAHQLLGSRSRHVFTKEANRRIVVWTLSNL